MKRLAALLVAWAGLWRLPRTARRLPRPGGAARDSDGVALEKALMQRRLRESRRRLQLLLDHMPDGVLAFDAEGRVQWINPAARLMFQRSAADTVGHPISSLMPALQMDSVSVQSTVPDGVVPPAAPRTTLEGLRADGSSFPIEAALVRLSVDGAVSGMCVVRDVSQSQRMERMKHEFVSMVSHELRTPLTSLRGSLALLADGTIEGLPADAQRLLRLASDNAERLVALVNDILDFEKLSAGALRIEPEHHDLRQLVLQAVDAIEGMARQSQVVLRVMATDPVFPVLADPARLMQVMNNLLSNAIKYSPAHGTVMLILKRRSEWVRLSVVDQGPGVPPEFEARLFEPFAQAHDPRYRKQGGTGLGLAISRALMETMQGSIGLEPPREGQGASFWIELPLDEDRPSTFGRLE